jgi:hypothetical protein
MPLLIWVLPWCYIKPIIHCYSLNTLGMETDDANWLQNFYNSPRNLEWNWLLWLIVLCHSLRTSPCRATAQPGDNEGWTGSTTYRDTPHLSDNKLWLNITWGLNGVHSQPPALIQCPLPTQLTISHMCWFGDSKFIENRRLLPPLESWSNNASTRIR